MVIFKTEYTCRAENNLKLSFTVKCELKSSQWKSLCFPIPNAIRKITWNYMQENSILWHYNNMFFECVTFPGLVKFWYFYKTLEFLTIFTSFVLSWFHSCPSFFHLHFTCPNSNASSQRSCATPGNSALWEAGKGKVQVLATSAETEMPSLAGWR